MKEIATVLAAAAITTGCVKVQLLPEDAFKNTWKAGKNMYDESKLKKDGGQKREYSNQVILSAYSSREEAEISCTDTVKKRLEKESLTKPAIVASERIILVDGMDNNVIECQVVGFVWP